MDEKKQVDRGFEAAPHRAVRLSLEADTTNHLVEVIAGPRQFPRLRPIGCPRAPVVPDWHQLQSQSRQSALVLKGDAGGYAGSSDHGNKWPALMHAVESEICRVNDFVDADGVAGASHCGRSELVHTIKRLSLPQRTSAALGKICIYAHALIWLGRRVRELADISAKVTEGHPISVGAFEQWSRIISKVAAPTGLPMVVEKIGEEWRDHMESIRCHIPGRYIEALRAIVRTAASTATDMKKSQLVKRVESWRSFSDRQVASGASLAHGLVKPDSTPANVTATTVVNSLRTASPQAILDRDLLVWSCI